MAKGRLLGLRGTLGMIVLGGIIVQAGCGGAGSSSSSGGGGACTDAPAAETSGTLPSVQVQHVFVVLLENHAYQDVMGNTQTMPYLNGLAQKYAYAKGYYADAHPSIPNYFFLTTGQTISMDDGFSSTVNSDNIVRHLLSAGLSWREYSESLPSVGYDGGDTGSYVEHHDPLSYFSDVRQSSTQVMNLVPFSALAQDMSAHTLPAYAFIVPNDQHNAHDCPGGGSGCTDSQKLSAADQWLQANIDPLIQSSDFSTPGGGILIVTFDESLGSDTSQGGGHTAWVVAGPDIKPGYSSSVCYQHQSTLRFMSEVIGMNSFPGAASNAPDMREFLKGN